MKLIPLANNRGYAAVDDTDYAALVKYRWHLHRSGGDNSGKGYAARGERRGKRVVVVRMHRQIVDAPMGMEVDHINGDRLDNRRENLRVTSKLENLRNRRFSRA